MGYPHLTIRDGRAVNGKNESRRGLVSSTGPFDHLCSAKKRTEMADWIDADKEMR